MEAVNSDPNFRQLGSVEIDIVFESGKHRRRICFRDFGVDHIEDCSDEDMIDADLVVSMPTVSWNSYLHKRRIGVGPSLQSLNIERSIIVAKSAMARRKFDRVHRSIQAFVDTGARLLK